MHLGDGLVIFPGGVSLPPRPPPLNYILIVLCAIMTPYTAITTPLQALPVCLTDANAPRSQVCSLEPEHSVTTFTNHFVFFPEYIVT